MKQLELTEEKAKQLNNICKFAIDKGVNSPFDISYYQTINDSFDLNYYLHLMDVARQYDTQKLIDILGRNICATHNTAEFLKSDGFLRILKIEKREDDIQDSTLRNLRQSIFATKDWWLLFGATLFFAALVSITTNLATDKLLKRNLPQVSTQDSLLKSLTSYILHRDSLSISYKDSLKIKKIEVKK